MIKLIMMMMMMIMPMMIMMIAKDEINVPIALSAFRDKTIMMMMMIT